MENEQGKFGENLNFEHVIVRHSENASASNKNMIVVTQQEHKELHQHMLP